MLLFYYNSKTTQAPSATSRDTGTPRNFPKLLHKKRSRFISTSSLVGLPGLEPGKAGPESAVLPLHHSPIISSAKVLQVKRTTKQFAKFFYTIFTSPRKRQLYQQVTEEPNFHRRAYSCLLAPCRLPICLIIPSS